MRMNVSVEWENCPGSGKIEVTYCEFVAGTVAIGAGCLDGNSFSFTGTGPCKLLFAVEVDKVDSSENQATVSICDTEKPFTFALKDVLADKPVTLPGLDVLVAAEADLWSNL